MEENEDSLVESTESVNTLYQFDEADDLSVDNLLYLMQGVGTYRDRKLALGSLLEWIAAKLESGLTLDSLLLIKNHENYKNIAYLDGDGLEVSNAKNESDVELDETLIAKLKTGYIEFSKYANSQLRGTVMTADGIELRHGSGNDRLKASILIDLNSDKIIIRDANGVNIEGLLYATDGIEVAQGKKIKTPLIEPDHIKKTVNGTDVTDMAFTENGLGINGRTSLERLNFNADKIISENYASSPISLYSRLFNSEIAVGDVVVVKNNHTIAESQKVYIKPDYYVMIAPMCCMAFICIGAYAGTSDREWAPLGNAEVTYDQNT